MPKAGRLWSNLGGGECSTQRNGSQRRSPNRRATRGFITVRRRARPPPAVSAPSRNVPLQDQRELVGVDVPARHDADDLSGAGTARSGDCGRDRPCALGDDVVSLR